MKDYGIGLEIDTFCTDGEKGPGEIIYRIVAEKDAETPRGVGVGDTLAELQEAYPDLIYDIFGKKDIFKEIDNVTSKGMDTKYFYINDSGEEETLLDIHSRSVEEKDIDNDGMTELVVYLTGNIQAIGVYDFVDGAISFIDINAALQCYYSEFAGNMGNIKHEYVNYIEATFKNEDGTERSEVYRVTDNQLTYVCPFPDKLIMRFLKWKWKIPPGLNCERDYF